jgi:hypothetical protein
MGCWHMGGWVPTKHQAELTHPLKVWDMSCRAEGMALRDTVSLS